MSLPPLLLPLLLVSLLPPSLLLLLPLLPLLLLLLCVLLLLLPMLRLLLDFRCWRVLRPSWSGWQQWGMLGNCWNDQNVVEKKTFFIFVPSYLPSAIREGRGSGVREGGSYQGHSPPLPLPHTPVVLDTVLL